MLKQFEIFLHSDKTYQAVKVGFCWPAFFFPAFWALWARLIGIGIGCFVLSLLLGGIAGLIVETYSSALAIIFVFPLRIIMGFKGNYLRKNKLLANGFEKVGEISASDSEEAILSYSKTRMQKVETV